MRTNEQEEKCMIGIRKTKEKLALIPEDRRYYLLIHNEQKDVESTYKQDSKMLGSGKLICSNAY